MENNQESYINEVQMKIGEINAEIERKKQELVSTLISDEKKVPNRNNQQELDAIGDLFYNSVKTFFDIGFKLAKNLNLEFLTDEKNGEIKRKKE
ncbi:MAG: hypothetical protein O2U61_04355 [Candidatus Bathyarchaeota archaeon]|nr:hypothetical protein [Candidatus Bathyarchaeota archaeon]